jgi:hypothetical protein
MNSRLLSAVLAIGMLPGVTGCGAGILWACKRPEVTAYSLNDCEVDKCGKPRETGIPFYLPKPLLIISKNFRNIEDAKTGLTDTVPIPTGYDDQSKYADLNARTNFQGLQGGEPASGSAGQPPSSAATNTGTAVASGQHIFSPNGAPVTPGTVPGDGLAPTTFFTYQIVFVPDMTQKYGLKIRGGPGEIRAAMNLVNGWQFTGIGPFYMKDSATAQNILASGISTRLGGQAAADVIKASADLASKLHAGGVVGADHPQLQRLVETIGELPKDRVMMSIPNYAEIHVYEPHVAEGRMDWTEIAHLCFDRQYLGTQQVCKEYYAATAAALPAPPVAAAAATGTTALHAGGVESSVAKAAVAGVLGVPVDSPALTAAPATGLHAGGVGGLPAGGVNQVQVDCGAGGCKGGSKEFNLIKFGGWHKKEDRRPRTETRTVSGGTLLEAEGTAVGAATAGLASATTAASTAGSPAAGLAGTGAAGTATHSGGVGGAPAPPTIINQPVINQPTITQPTGPVIPAPQLPPNIPPAAGGPAPGTPSHLPPSTPPAVGGPAPVPPGPNPPVPPGPNPPSGTE